MISKGTKWIVVTKRGVRTFTNTEYMINYLKKRARMVVSVVQVM